MKIFILFISIFLFSCGSKEVDISEVYIKDNIYFLKSTNKAFTGYIVENYPGDYLGKFYVKRGKKDGESVYLYPEVKTVEKYKNGKLDGVSKTFKLGKLVNETEFRNGLLNGDDISYYSDGSIESKSTYKDGNLIGDTIRYYENGNTKSKSKHTNEGLAGEYLEYYENGNIKTKASVKNNKLDGEIKIYSTTGNILKEATLKENEIEKYKEYYENGNLKISFVYEDNKKEYKEYYEDNKIKLDKVYNLDEEGMLSFRKIEYYKSGIKSSYSIYTSKSDKENNRKLTSLEYVIQLLESPKLLLETLIKDKFSTEEINFQKNFEWLYNEDGYIIKELYYFTTTDKIYPFDLSRMRLYGKIRQEIVYEDKKPVKLKERIIYNEGSILIDCTYREVDIVNGKKEGNVEEKGDYITRTYKYINDLRQGEAQIISGKDSVLKYKYKDDKRNGSAVIYYSDGAREEFNYKNGVIEGKAIFYNKFGDREEYTYINGKKEGKATSYSIYGGKLTGNYKNDKKEGKWIRYIDGKKNMEINYKNGELDGEYLEYPLTKWDKKIKVYEYINGVKYYIGERDVK